MKTMDRNFFFKPGTQIMNYPLVWVILKNSEYFLAFKTRKLARKHKTLLRKEKCYSIPIKYEVKF